MKRKRKQKDPVAQILAESHGVLYVDAKVSLIPIECMEEDEIPIHEFGETPGRFWVELATVVTWHQRRGLPKHVEMFERLTARAKKELSPSGTLEGESQVGGPD